jgi:hypothetical protein
MEEAQESRVEASVWRVLARRPRLAVEHNASGHPSLADYPAILSVPAEEGGQGRGIQEAALPAHADREEQFRHRVPVTQPPSVHQQAVKEERQQIRPTAANPLGEWRRPEGVCPINGVSGGFMISWPSSASGRRR